MQPSYFDAHNHLHDPRLEPWRTDFLKTLPVIGVRSVVTNGTSEADWKQVEMLSVLHPWIIPSFGLHPWFVNERSKNWQGTLLEYLTKNPRAGVGECGLDRWIEGHDIRLQTEIFCQQLQIATQHQRALSIHCIRAWGPLLDILQNNETPSRGFLIHAYAGPLEMMESFTKLGAYFSFSPYFLHERKTMQREVFRLIPLERLLVETDAPDMAPPAEADVCPIITTEGKTLNHPSNLLTAYKALADIRNMPLEVLAQQIEANWHQLFHSGSTIIRN